MPSVSSNLMPSVSSNLTALPASGKQSSSPDQPLLSLPLLSSDCRSGLPTEASAPPAEKTGQEHGVEHTAQDAQNTRYTMARVVPPDCCAAAGPIAGSGWLLQKWKSRCRLLDVCDDAAACLRETLGCPPALGSPRALCRPQTLEASNMGQWFVVVIRLTHFVLQAPAWAQFIKSCPGDGVRRGRLTRGSKGPGDEEASDADGDADGRQDPEADSAREDHAPCLQPAPSCTSSACRDLACHFYATLSRALSDTPSHACQAPPLGVEGLAWRCTRWELVAADIAVVNMRLVSRRQTVAEDFWLPSCLEKHLDGRLKAAGATCLMVFHTHLPCPALALSLRADSCALDTSQALPNKGARQGGHSVADTQEFLLESERERELQQFPQHVSSHALHKGDRCARSNGVTNQVYHKESADDVFSSRSVAGQVAPGQKGCEALRGAGSEEHGWRTRVGARHAAPGDAGGKQRAEGAISATRKHGDMRATHSEMYMQSMSQVDADDMAALPPEIQAELRLLPKHRPGRRNGKSARPLARLYKGAGKAGSGRPGAQASMRVTRESSRQAVTSHRGGVGSGAGTRGAQGEGQSSAAPGIDSGVAGIDSAVVLELEKQMGVRASSLVQS